MKVWIIAITIIFLILSAIFIPVACALGVYVFNVSISYSIFCAVSFALVLTGMLLGACVVFGPDYQWGVNTNTSTNEIESRRDQERMADDWEERNRLGGII